MPVSSQLFSKSDLMVSISAMPMGDGMSIFFCLMIYCRLKRVSIIPALEEGLPMPFCFKAERNSSSSTNLPAVSMARSRAASVYGFGAEVCFSFNSGVCCPCSPSVNFGRMASFSSESFSSILANVAFQPLSIISFPVALNGMMPE